MKSIPRILKLDGKTDIMLANPSPSRTTGPFAAGQASA